MYTHENRKSYIFWNYFEKIPFPRPFLSRSLSVSDKEFWRFVQQVTNERKELASGGLIRFAQLRRAEAKLSGI